MYCKHCGTQLADWQKTCHICGTPVDSDAKKTFLDDIDFSETEELSDAINEDEGKTKIFNVEDDDISKTQDLSGIADTKIFEENNNVFSMLPFLTRLRQICVEPRTFIKNYQGDSAKINLLNSILDEYLPQGRKILIFSQFVEVLKLIGEDLNKKNVPYYMLTGETKADYLYVIILMMKIL